MSFETHICLQDLENIVLTLVNVCKHSPVYMKADIAKASLYDLPYILKSTFRKDMFTFALSFQKIHFCTSLVECHPQIIERRH